MTSDSLITTTREGSWVIARWDGDIDMANARPVEDQTLAALVNTDEGLTIDLSDTHYIDSAGLRALVEIRRRLSERQQAFDLILPAGSTLEKALEVGGILTLIERHESEEAARAAH